jgi:hypothetical protein
VNRCNTGISISSTSIQVVPCGMVPEQTAPLNVLVANNELNHAEYSNNSSYYYFLLRLFVYFIVNNNKQLILRIMVLVF